VLEQEVLGPNFTGLRYTWAKASFTKEFSRKKRGLGRSSPPRNWILFGHRLDLARAGEHSWRGWPGFRPNSFLDSRWILDGIMLVLGIESTSTHIQIRPTRWYRWDNTIMQIQIRPSWWYRCDITMIQTQMRPIRLYWYRLDLHNDTDKTTWWYRYRLDLHGNTDKTRRCCR
jgi:hypothetical protein